MLQIRKHAIQIKKPNNHALNIIFKSAVHKKVKCLLQTVKEPISNGHFMSVPREPYQGTADCHFQLISLAFNL